MQNKTAVLIGILFFLGCCPLIKTSTVEAAAQQGQAGLGSAYDADDMFCEESYSVILDDNGAEFYDCYAEIQDSGCGQGPGSSDSRPVNLILIMDSSGSMAARVKGQTRMAVAQQAATVFLRGLKNDVRLALMLYGHKGSNNEKDKDISCKGIETLVPLNEIDHAKLNRVIDSLRPVGYTPIGDSLAEADALLSEYPADDYRNVVILISDGKETCGGDPVAQARTLNKSNSHGIINVIGLDVGGEVEKQLNDIAEAGEGIYYSARTVGELNTVLANLAKQECAIDKESKALDAGLSAELNMMSCKNKLTFEKDAILLEIGLMDDKRCQKYSYHRYRDRYYSIKHRLGNIYRQGRAEIQKTFGDSDMASEYDEFFDNSEPDFPSLSEMFE